VIEMVAPDGITVAISPESEDMEVGTRETHPRCERQSSAVDEVDPVTIDEVGKSRRASDPGDRADLLMGDLEFLEHLEKGGEHGKVTATGTPGRVVGGEVFFGERLG